MSTGLQGIGDWQLHEVIGEGDRATVYRGQSSHGGDTAPEMAVKVLHRALAEDAAAAGEFEARARRGALLTSPWIVTQRGLERADGQPYGVWDLVHGASVADMTGGRKPVTLPPGELCAIIEDTLSALRDAQQASPPVAHGRLDGGAILVDGSGRCRLMGFGEPGDGRDDLPALAQLLQPLSDGGDAELDAWFDALLQPASPYTAASALEELPRRCEADERVALGARAERARKRLLRRRRKAAAKKEAEGSGGAAPRDPEDAKAALSQARWVALFCVLTLLAAVLIELLLSGR